MLKPLVTLGYGLTNTNDVLARYSNVDWAGNVDDLKSTSDGCFYLDNNLVSKIRNK